MNTATATAQTVTTEPTPPRIFNGRYTVESTRTGEHRTFQISTQCDTATFAPGKRIVGLLTKSQNDDDRSYTSFGFVDCHRGVSVWKSKRSTLDQRAPSAYEIYADMINVLAGKFRSSFNRPWEGYELHLEGTCLRCNRVLTDPTSIRLGIGPVCIEKGSF